VKVLDMTNPAQPRLVKTVALPDEAHNIYLVRTYAYVAAGKRGLVILDIEKPEEARIDQEYTAGGKINDAHDVKVGMTNVSLFAYIADGHNGLRVVQLTSPEHTEGHYGWSPRPTPELIATRHTHAPALAVSEGIDRDRAIDEMGNQLTVFGRRGARPLNFTELQRLYMKDGKIFTVPELKDSNIKRNKDVRDAFGEPKLTDTAEKKKSVETEGPAMAEDQPRLEPQPKAVANTKEANTKAESPAKAEGPPKTGGGQN
jgi:LVIVD repeat